MSRKLAESVSVDAPPVQAVAQMLGNDWLVMVF
jgi:hypothetical protein